jgi:DNA-binding NtrC family response regulator
LIATATRSPSKLTAKGEFPRELACALGTIEIELPPLTERLEDLPSLAQLLVEEANSIGDKQISSITSEALDLLAAHTWPGNLDELAAVVTEAHARATGTQITLRDLPQRIHWTQEATRGKHVEDAIHLEEFLARAERELIERALARAKGNKTRAAKLLGMTRPRFYRRLVQLKLIE